MDVNIFVLDEVKVGEIIEENVSIGLWLRELYIDEESREALSKVSTNYNVISLGVQFSHSFLCLLIRPKIRENEHWDLVILKKGGYISCPTGLALINGCFEYNLLSLHIGKLLMISIISSLIFDIKI